MNLRRALTVLAVSAATIGTSAIAADAITGGSADGDGHPNVAVIAFYAAGSRSRCTATLVTPTVLVTAGHCTDGVDGKVAVSFSSVVAQSPADALPPAQDPNSGYTGDELAAAGWLGGLAFTHPGYSHSTDKANWNDVGVVVLDQPVLDIAPATVAPAGYLDQITPDALGSTAFTTVGYGVQIGRAPSGSQRPTPISYPIERRVAEEPGQQLFTQILQVHNNPNNPNGTGGTCYGDSGGPSFNGGYEVAVTSYTLSKSCESIAGLQRLDIPAVQSWLETFGIQPAS